MDRRAVIFLLCLALVGCGHDDLALGGGGNSAGGQNNPANNTTNNTTISGGQLLSLQFTPSANYNGKTAAQPPGPIEPPLKMEATLSNVTGTTSATIIFHNSGGVNSTIENLVVGVFSIGNNVVVGQSYPMHHTVSTGGLLGLNYTPFGAITANQVWVSGDNTTGNVTVMGLNNNSLDLQFNIANVGPDPTVANNTATGTFNITGRFAANVTSIINQ